jgi:HEPN domain-containing protein
MNKNEHINYWTKSSEDDWTTAITLFESKRFLHSLFFAHLSIEKIIKALWVKNCENNIPPKIHNLVKLIMDSKVELSDEQMKFLFEFNDFQIEGRYPDYLFEINKKCTYEFTTNIFEEIKKVKICLLKNL